MRRPVHIPIARPAAAAAVATLVTVLGVLLAGGPPSSVAATAQRPNVIVVLTDDETVGELTKQTMPKTLRLLGNGGTTFTNSVVSSPLCCPSRAGFLTGEYPHNSGVYDNEPGYSSLIDKQNILYSWLQNAGYRTGHIGRFLLNYDRAAPPGMNYDTHGGLDNPGGLDDWYGYVGAETKYYGATFSDNGTAHVAGTGPGGYTTSVINREALDFVRGAQTDPRPFFLMVAHVAPHASNAVEPGDCVPGRPASEDAARSKQFRNEALPKPPSFDEQPITDKPNWVRTRPALGSKRRHDLKLGCRCALGTLPTVDTGVAQLVKQLKQEGELDNTAIFFTSDNGYFFGEHRIFLNKVYPYEEALQVPLIAKLPQSALGPSAQRHGQPAEVSDPGRQTSTSTATVLDLANASPCTPGGECRTLDGRSLMPLLDGHKPRLGQGPRAALPDRIQTDLRPAARRPRPQHLLRRGPDPPLRLHRAQPRQRGHRPVRPARVRALRPEEGPVRAAKPGREPGAGADPVGDSRPASPRACTRWRTATAIAGRDPRTRARTAKVSHSRHASASQRRTWRE